MTQPTNPATDDTISVSDLSKHYAGRSPLFGKPAASFKAVDHISFAIRRGEVLGLVGESGSGKSTIGALLLGLDRPTSGNIDFRGLGRIDPGDAGIRLKFARAAQLVFQNPYEALNPRHTIGDSILEPIKTHFPGDRPRQQALLVQAMERAGLAPWRNYVQRYPHELSGGQLQRVVIARAISVEPDFLVADEPVAMLDVSIRASILNLLRGFAEELGMSILYISHDLSTMRHLCTRIAVMYRGRIVELGDTAQVLDRPRHPYSIALAASVPILAARGTRERPPMPSSDLALARPSHGCAYAPRCIAAMEVCRVSEPALRRPMSEHLVACHLVDVPSPEASGA